MATVIRKQKTKKKGVTFNLMVVGPSGSGKTTFINTLCEGIVMPRKDYSDPQSISFDKTVSISSYTTDIDRISLTVLDTPGFGDSINNEPSFQEILSYVERQYDAVLNEEARVKRNTKSVDSRVHCILYFLTPNGHGLREVDVTFIRKLGSRANILPVIAKSDSLTPRELIDFRKKIQEDLQVHQLPFFNFPIYEEEDDEDIIEENKFLRSVLPFAVMGADKEEDGLRVRKYPWGVVSGNLIQFMLVENPKHSDFSALRKILFDTHLDDFKEITHEVLYEGYRTLKLSSSALTNHDEE